MMKIFITTFLILLFFFVTIKDIYDSNKFLMEDVRILERDLGEKDSIVLKLQYQNEKLKQKIVKLTKVKKIKKPILKPVVTKQEIKVEEPILIQNDTLP